jgi:hypothetical protein
MADPWTLARDFISDQQQQNLVNRQATDNIMIRAIEQKIARDNAATAQQYGLERLGKVNEYNTTAATVANERQGQRDERLHGYDVSDYGMKRKDQLSDAEAAARGAATKDTIDHQQAIELALINNGVITQGGARRYGKLTPSDSTMAATMQRESGGRGDAKNPNSSARGYFQWTDSTWNGLMRKYPQLGLTPDGRGDPNQEKRAYEVFTRDNQAVLSQNGIDVTPATTYAAHFLGAGGAVNVLRHSDDTPLSSILGDDVMGANPVLQGKTVAGFKQWLEKNHGGGGSDADGSESASTGGSGYEAATTRRYLDQRDPNLPAPTLNADSDDPQAAQVDVSPELRAKLAEKNLEPELRRKLNADEMANLVRNGDAANWVIDPWDVGKDNQKGDKTEYVRVRPKANQNADLKSLKETTHQTEAAPVELSSPKSTVQKRTLQMADGRVIEY